MNSCKLRTLNCAKFSKAWKVFRVFKLWEKAVSICCCWNTEIVGEKHEKTVVAFKCKCLMKLFFPKRKKINFHVFKCQHVIDGAPP